MNILPSDLINYIFELINLRSKIYFCASCQQYRKITKDLLIKLVTKFNSEYIEFSIFNAKIEDKSSILSSHDGGNKPLVLACYDGDINETYLNHKDSSKICDNLAYFGYFDKLKWAKTEGRFEWNEWISFTVAKRGYLEILKWIKEENNCRWAPSNFTYYAAQIGHFEMLKWVKGKKDHPQWNDMVCTGASEKGHLEILKWAIQNDCLLRYDDCIQIAHANGQSEIVKWLEENHCR